MATAHTGFVAYPIDNADIADAMREAVDLSSTSKLRLVPWEKLANIGLQVDQLIRDRISESSVLLADITFSNFNVYYEIGFALAQEKPIIPLVNTAYHEAKFRAQSTGIFDTTGWLTYENSAQLVAKLQEWNDVSWTPNLKKDKNHLQPLFILDTITKTNARNYIFSAVTNSGVNFRAFDPAENPRLTASHAIGEVSSSAGVIVLLLKSDIVGAHLNNLRAAFVAGLAHGFGLEAQIMQFDDGPAPLDFRDLVTNSKGRLETENHVTEYCQKVLVQNQKSSGRTRKSSLGLLNKIDLGASAAEGEGELLNQYFISTGEYSRALRSAGALLVGRKGSGKSAIAIRATAELSRNKRNLILDLKPAAHNLSDLREQLLSSLDKGFF